MMIETTIDAHQPFGTLVRKNKVWVYTENMPN